MSGLRHWLVLGKGDDDETFVVWDEEDAAAYGFAWEHYRVDGPFVLEVEQQTCNETAVTLTEQRTERAIREGDREKLLDLLEKIAQECMTMGEVDVVWIGTRARLAVDRHRGVVDAQG